MRTKMYKTVVPIKNVITYRRDTHRLALRRQPRFPSACSARLEPPRLRGRLLRL